MIPGYHAGELWLHDPLVALKTLHEMGYQAVAIRPRAGFLVPSQDSFASQWQGLCQLARDLPCQIVIDTEALFVDSVTEAFFPSLAFADLDAVARTTAWLARWIELASELPGTLVSIASGQIPQPPVIQPPVALPPDSPALDHPAPDRPTSGAIVTEEMLQRVAHQLEPLCRQAASAGVTLAMRPAAGHVIGSVAQFERFLHWLSGDCPLALAADVGEMLAASELPLGARLQRHPDTLRLVYLCDQRSAGWEDPSADNPAHHAMGRRDVPIGSGEVAAERLLPNLWSQNGVPTTIVRVAGRASAGLQPAVDAMKCLSKIPCWADAVER